MKSRGIQILGAAVWLGLALAGPAAAGDEDEERLRIVREVLSEVPLVDGHNDAPYQIREGFANHLAWFDFTDTSAVEPAMHTDISRLRQGGVGAQFWSVWVPTDQDDGAAVVAVLEQIDLVHRLVEAYPDDLELATTAADIRRIHGEGRIASLIGLEGGHSIARSLAVLRQLYALGARYMTLTHWINVAWADAATDAPAQEGLSAFGEIVVREMNRLGMLVDLSHVSAEVMADVLDLSGAPVIFSHSNALAENFHPRNVPDDILLRLRENGGIVMVNFGAFFVDESYVHLWASSKAEKARLQAIYPGNPGLVTEKMTQWNEANPEPKFPLGRLVDHIDHIRAVAGIDHVGLGSDFDGISAAPEGLEDVSCYPVLLAELLSRGYSRDDIAKVAGSNILRVMEAAEAVALEMQASDPPFDERFEELDEVSVD